MHMHTKEKYKWALNLALGIIQAFSQTLFTYLDGFFMRSVVQC